MKVIVCVDDRLGTEFNRRPLARDRELMRDLMLLVGRERLWMEPRFLPLLPEEARKRVFLHSDPLSAAAPGDYVFSAGKPLQGHEDGIEELILYRWNRLYPSDRKLDLNPDAWRQVQEVSFAGSSHSRITRETYKP